MKRIGDILTRNKTAVVVQDEINYKQVTIRTNYKGVVLRGTQLGSTIGTKNQFAVSAGQFILSRIDARNGAFGIIPDELEGAIVTNDFLAFDINEDEVERDFFNIFLQSPVFLDACVKASRGNTNRKRVDEQFFLDYPVALPPLEEQQELIDRFNKGRANLSRITMEIHKQQSLLKSLRAAVIEDAIRGRLTADWRLKNIESEHADSLVKRIRSMKTRLIEENNLRAERSKSHIEPSEIPFELPESWAWCRLGAVTRFFDYRGKTPLKQTHGIRLITAKNVRPGYFSDTPRDYVSEENYLRHMVRGFPENGDILFTTEAPLGNACQLNFNDRFALGQRLITIQPILSNKKYFLYAIRSNAIQRQLVEKSSGITAKGIKSSRLVDVLIPMPPLVEQDAIVEQADKLVQHHHELVADVENSLKKAEILMQSMLRDIFSPS